MRSGTLDRRIAIQRATVADDGFSSAGTETWSDLVSLWCHVTPISDGERWRSGQVGVQSTHRFTIRHSTISAGITVSDRVIYQGRIYEINGVKPSEDRNRFVEITATAGA